MDTAIKNKQTIDDIRRRMLAGIITYDQAQVEATPILATINKKAEAITKKHGFKHKPLTFKYVMR